MSVSAPHESDQTPRSTGRAVLVAIGTAIGTALVVYLVVALATYTLASFDRQGLDRPHFRSALVIGLGAAGLAGIGVGVAAGVLYRRGFAWRAERSGSLGTRVEEPPIVDDWIPGR